MEVFFENEYCKLGYHKDLSIIILKWKNFKTIEFDEFKKPYDIAIKYNENVHVDNYIVDALEQGVISPAYRKWFQDVALKEGVRQGLKRAVFISNANIFKRYYINNIMNSTKTVGLPLKVTTNMNDALAWIKSFYKL